MTETYENRVPLSSITFNQEGLSTILLEASKWMQQKAPSGRYYENHVHSIVYTFDSELGHLFTVIYEELK